MRCLPRLDLAIRAPLKAVRIGAPLLASTGLDRLTHKAQLVVIAGASSGAHGSYSLQKEVPTEPEDYR